VLQAINDLLAAPIAQRLTAGASEVRWARTANFRNALMADDDIAHLDRDGAALAYRRTPGRAPGIVFLPGFASDMTGDKATRLAALAAARGQACLRLDYSGHGASSGRFEDGTIGRWADDATALFDALTEGPQVVVGSSMGGWIALLLARRRPERVAALVGIAAAPDFTRRLRAAIPASAFGADGVFRRPSAYGPPLAITRALIEEGEQHCLLDGPIAIDCPVRLLHGQGDPDVPWALSITLAERLVATDVQVTLVKDGDHRLSRPADLALLERVVAPLLGEDCR